MVASCRSEEPEHPRNESLGSSFVVRMWTGKGDDGTSGLFYGGREPKTAPRFQAIGDIDEAQAHIGLARAETPEGSEVNDVLAAVERDLWVLMAEVATDDTNRDKLVSGSTMVSSSMLESLETLTDDIGNRFELPAEFVVPGEDRISALLDVARTVVRRAERSAAAIVDPPSLALPYLNRLSSLLWVLARWVEGTPLTARDGSQGPRTADG